MDQNSIPEPNVKRANLQDYSLEMCLEMIRGLGVVVSALDNSEISDMNGSPLDALGDAIELYALQADAAYGRLMAECRQGAAETDKMRGELAAMKQACQRTGRRPARKTRP